MPELAIEKHSPSPLELIQETLLLLNGDKVRVDESDFAFLNQWTWGCHTTLDGLKYASRRERRENGKSRRVYLHRLLMGLEPGDKREVDHVNHNTLDNRRLNLRVVTGAQNRYNRRSMGKNKSGFKGVHKNHNRWAAEIRINGKAKFLGNFVNPEDAHRVYREAVILHHGEYACLE